MTVKFAPKKKSTSFMKCPRLEKFIKKTFKANPKIKLRHCIICHSLENKKQHNVSRAALKDNHQMWCSLRSAPYVCVFSKVAARKRSFKRDDDVTRQLWFAMLFAQFKSIYV